MQKTLELDLSDYLKQFQSLEGNGAPQYKVPGNKQGQKQPLWNDK